MSGKILIVDDNLDICKLLSSLLTHYGFQTLTAPNGKAGLQLASRQYPDVIIADLLMPEMNGIELLKHLREDPDLVATPVLIFTANSEMKAAPIIETGATAVFYKPLDLQAMVEYVRNFFNNR